MNLEFFDHFLKYPGMYAGQPTYERIVVYLHGLDAGSDGLALLGFKEWIFTKRGERCSTGWPGAVEQHAIQQLNRTLYLPEDEEFLVEQLFALLREYLAERKEHEGLKKIFVRYQRMIESYDGFIPEFDGVP